MGSYYTDLDNDLGDELEAWRNTDRAKKSKHRRDREKTIFHTPKTDDEAKALIEELGTYVWTTVKVRGSYVMNPYSIYAHVRGRKHLIYLPGRRGTVLSWLMAHIDAGRTEPVGVEDSMENLDE